VHIYIQTTQNDTEKKIHTTTQKFWKIAGRAPSWLVIYPGICLPSDVIISLREENRHDIKNVKCKVNKLRFLKI
jgi:hypothetical protein